MAVPVANRDVVANSVASREVEVERNVFEFTCVRGCEYPEGLA